MPELPEVETIKTAIAQVIGHCNITAVKVNNNKFREMIPADLAEKFRGVQISGYRRIAKYIIIDCANGLSLIWHLGMSGRVKITDNLPNPLEKHDHVVISTDKGYLIFHDPRRFGLLTYCPTEDLECHHLLNHLGPDPFSGDFNAAYLYEELQKKKVPVKVALLDQEIVVGIGNIYASETLYCAGVLPTRPANRISFKECESIVREARAVLTKAIEAGGSTLRDYQKPDGSLGYFQNQHCVYNKTGQKCPDCQCDINLTGGIKRIVQAGRSTYFCPVKQK